MARRVPLARARPRDDLRSRSLTRTLVPPARSQGGEYAHLNVEGLRYNHEEFRSFLSGDAIKNPEHETFRWSLDECTTTLGLEVIHQVTSCAIVAKMTEFILHNEIFEEDGCGSLYYASTSPIGEDGPWPARSTVAGISNGDSEHPGPGVVFIAYSHTIAPMLRSGTALCHPCATAPPRPFDIDALMQAEVPLGADHADAREPYRRDAHASIAPVYYLYFF